MRLVWGWLGEGKSRESNNRVEDGTEEAKKRRGYANYSCLVCKGVERDGVKEDVLVMVFDEIGVSWLSNLGVMAFCCV